MTWWAPPEITHQVPVSSIHRLDDRGDRHRPARRHAAIVQRNGAWNRSGAPSDPATSARSVAGSVFVPVMASSKTYPREERSSTQTSAQPIPGRLRPAEDLQHRADGRA